MKKPMIEPYLFFAGRCEEALEFYESALGAKRVMLMRFEEAPDQPPEGMLTAGWEKKVMHAAVFIGDCMVMMSDGCGPEGAKFDGFRLSIGTHCEDEAKRFFNALAQEGSVEMPLGKTFWSPCYGMCTDKFGVGWMVSVITEVS
ncbi:MAG: VOC family protein [Verrucomicrobiota bacterium]